MKKTALAINNWLNSKTSTFQLAIEKKIRTRILEKQKKDQKKITEA